MNAEQFLSEQMEHIELRMNPNINYRIEPGMSPSSAYLMLDVDDKTTVSGAVDLTLGSISAKVNWVSGSTHSTSQDAEAVITLLYIAIRISKKWEALIHEQADS